MVGIDNAIGNANTINNSQVIQRQKINTTTKAQPRRDFSSVLGNIQNKQKAQAENIQPSPKAAAKNPALKEELNSYSPLMIRYGVNRINEIKQIAVESGVDDLTKEDFDYAIRYGRSIIADYLI